jgi:hypothetical protein
VITTVADRTTTADSEGTIVLVKLEVNVVVGDFVKEFVCVAVSVVEADASMLTEADGTNDDVTTIDVDSVGRVAVGV